MGLRCRLRSERWLQPGRPLVRLLGLLLVLGTLLFSAVRLLLRRALKALGLLALKPELARKLPLGLRTLRAVMHGPLAALMLLGTLPLLAPTQVLLGLEAILRTLSQTWALLKTLGMLRWTPLEPQRTLLLPMRTSSSFWRDHRWRFG